jgi:uncharacterized membrane protein (UPF0127 family)
VILAAGLAIALAAPLGPCRPTVSAATARGDVAILVEVAGMWFIFSNEKVRRFWMRNTLIPLDIIYVSAAGLVVSIIRRATPESDRSLPSEKPALYVLELAGGEARRLGIEVGNKLSVCGVAGPS